jgi:hypothetical protein
MPPTSTTDLENSCTTLQSRLVLFLVILQIIRDSSMPKERVQSFDGEVEMARAEPKCFITISTVARCCTAHPLRCDLKPHKREKRKHAVETPNILLGFLLNTP